MTIRRGNDESQVVELVDRLFDRLRDDIAEDRDKLTDIENRLANRSAHSFHKTAFSALRHRADGMRSFAVAFVTDGRKDGESAGRGTGVPVWYNPNTDQWLRFSDNEAVTV